MKKRTASFLLAIAATLAGATVAHAGESTGNPCEVNKHDGTQAALVGTSDKDTLTGSEWGDAICGRNGADVIYGLGGRDWIAGNHGNDTLYGGAGDDVIIPGKGQDTVDCGSGYDTVRINFETGGESYTDCEVFVDPA